MAAGRSGDRQTDCAKNIKVCWFVLRIPRLRPHFYNDLSDPCDNFNVALCFPKIGLITTIPGRRSSAIWQRCYVVDRAQENGKKSRGKTEDSGKEQIAFWVYRQSVYFLTKRTTYYTKQVQTLQDRAMEGGGEEKGGNELPSAYMHSFLLSSQLVQNMLDHCEMVLRVGIDQLAGWLATVAVVVSFQCKSP